jgi:hypothetical protein
MQSIRRRPRTAYSGAVGSSLVTCHSSLLLVLCPLRTVCPSCETRQRFSISVFSFWILLIRAICEICGCLNVTYLNLSGFTRHCRRPRAVALRGHMPATPKRCEGGSLSFSAFGFVCEAAAKARVGEESFALRLCQSPLQRNHQSDWSA